MKNPIFQVRKLGRKYQTESQPQKIGTERKKQNKTKHLFLVLNEDSIDYLPFIVAVFTSGHCC